MPTIQIDETKGTKKLPTHAKVVVVGGGVVGGVHMVKLEDQGVITDDGFETMSVYPWDPRLFVGS